MFELPDFKDLVVKDATKFEEGNIFVRSILMQHKIQ